MVAAVCLFNAVATGWAGEHKTGISGKASFYLPAKMEIAKVLVLAYTAVHTTAQRDGKACRLLGPVQPLPLPPAHQQRSHGVRHVIEDCAAMSLQRMLLCLAWVWRRKEDEMSLQTACCRPIVSETLCGSSCKEWCCTSRGLVGSLQILSSCQATLHVRHQLYRHRQHTSFGVSSSAGTIEGP